MRPTWASARTLALVDPTLSAYFLFGPWLHKLGLAEYFSCAQLCFATFPIAIGDLGPKFVAPAVQHARMPLVDATGRNFLLGRHAHTSPYSPQTGRFFGALLASLHGHMQGGWDGQVFFPLVKMPPSGA